MENENNEHEFALICSKCGENHLCPIGFNFFTGFTKFQCKKCFANNVYPIRKYMFNQYVLICVMMIFTGAIPGFFYLYIFIKNKLIWKNLNDDQKGYFLNWDFKTPHAKFFSFTHVACKKPIK